MKLASRLALLAICVALVGCGKDAASEANKNLKPVDPNAPKPSAATGGPGAATKSGGAAAAEGPAK